MLSILATAHGGVALFIAFFLLSSTATRLLLLVEASRQVTWDASLLASFAWGLVFDLGTAAWCSLPVIILLTLLPARWLGSRAVRWASASASVVLAASFVLAMATEFMFWEEFGARPNFIAVDYLIYTTEVLGNIRESYPVAPILAAVLGLGVLASWAAWRSGLPEIWHATPVRPWQARWRAGAVWLVAAVAVGSLIDSSWLPDFPNRFNREIAKNGTWSFVNAFQANELDYESFYLTESMDTACDQLREELVEDGSVMVHPEACDSLRSVTNDGPELHPNVIQITVESLSAEFMGIFDPESALTPRLDAIAEKSLVFENFFATGTRTVRGMEALTLSLPPTPGRSIVKRPNHENMFTLGSLFRSRGYDNSFLYGGHGYFDNMNHFFSTNGYRIVDRSKVEEEDVTFETVWGACDEDLFRWSLREADESSAKGRPFHQFVMTTSNHRPYTYPEGRIDLPPKVSGRAGGVRYTDYAIGQFLDEASRHSWYEDTVFVIVADHCASSAGRQEVSVERYHIPLIIFAPGGQVPPGRVSVLTSQMDYAPTLLGLLNWSYESRFLGHDVARIEADDAHALLGNYQALGHLEDDELVVLRPQRKAHGYTVKERVTVPKEEGPSQSGLDEAVAFYQVASHLVGSGKQAAPREGAGL